MALIGILAGSLNRGQTLNVHGDWIVTLFQTVPLKHDGDMLEKQGLWPLVMPEC